MKKWYKFEITCTYGNVEQVQDMFRYDTAYTETRPNSTQTKCIIYTPKKPSDRWKSFGCIVNILERCNIPTFCGYTAIREPKTFELIWVMTRP